MESSNTSSNGAIALKRNDSYQNDELLAEILRRTQFNFYWRLKFARIKFSKFQSKSIFSFKQDKFINYTFVDDDWQLPIFGLAQPHITKAINLRDKNQLPELANGYIGMRGFTDEVQMQSLFSSSYMATHRASIPSWTIRNITAVYDLYGHNIIAGRRMELDMSNGRLTQILYSEDCIVEQQIYAHQTLKSLLVHEIQVLFLTSKFEAIVLELPKGQKRDISGNVDITEETGSSKYTKIVSGITHVNDREMHEQHIHGFYHSIPDNIKVKKSKVITKYYYLMSLNENKTIALKHFDEGMSLMEDNNKLFGHHDYIWRKIWTNSGVFMRRSDKWDVALISAQYLINSNLPSIGQIDMYGAMGATGLGVVSNQGAGHSLGTNCGGRIDFTQELFMLSSQILLHPQSVKSIINKRIFQIPMAKKNALAYNYNGTKFPAATNELGEELCQNSSLCQNMFFPTGLVAFNLLKYLLATGDRTMFTKETGMGALMEINEFWKSVLQKYNIDKIESVPLSNLNLKVTNSIFDIGLIKETLIIIPSLINFFNITPSVAFANYILQLHNLSQSISLPFDRINNYNPPFDGFNLDNAELSSPDGVMLRYPLDHLVDVDLSSRNLAIYEKRLLPPLSPMSLSLLFINNMDADRFPSAADNFKNLVTFSNNPFMIWTNNSKLWKGSYIPAASGYLDSVLFGLVGIRIRRTGLYLFPKLILDISLIEVSGLEYLGSTIKIIVDINKGVLLQIVSTKAHAWPLGIMDVNRKISRSFRGIVTFPLETHIVIRRLKLRSNVVSSA